MVSLLIALLLWFTPFGQEAKDIDFEIRAPKNLLLGQGQKTGLSYYDVIITRQPVDGVLIKLPYTKKGGKFSFDLHHRIAVTEDFGFPAEVTTVIDVLTGATTSMGTYTIANTINAEDKFEEPLRKVSDAEIDRFVTPMSTKTITINIQPGPQSISIVGETLIITRGKTTTKVETPGTRIATVSNFKFQEPSNSTSLKN